MFETVDACLLQKKNKLFCDYMNDFNRVKTFYPSHYSQKKFRKTQPALPRDVLCDLLSSYNKKIGAPQRTLEAIERLEDENVFAVVSGQQSGLFMGPLYTVYKALSAIALAQAHDFVPIFWNASEDSDFEEINHTHFFSKEGVMELSTKNEGGGRPATDIPLECGEIERLLAQFSATAPETEFSDELLSNLKTIARESADFATFFSRILLWLFGEYGLIVIEPHLLRKASVPLLERVLENPSAISRMVEEEGGKLRLLGYDPQVIKKQDATNLFYVEDRRYPITFSQDTFHAGGKAYGREEMLDKLQGNPKSFSTNVILRPIVQDYLLPTAAYIAGPAEIAYFAQLSSAYEYLGVTQSLLYPRHSLTIVESRVKKTMDKYDADFLSLKNPQEVINSRARDTVEAYFGEFYSETDSLFDSIKAKTPASLVKSVEAARASTRKNILALQKKVASEKKREEETFVSQVEKASLALFPHGEMQERVVGFMEYYNKYGKRFIQQTYEAIKSTTPDKHILIYI